MLQDTIEDATAPTFATAGLNPQLFADMISDLNDGIRCESAITAEELDAMEAHHRQQQAETRVSVAGKRFKAEARYAGQSRWINAGTHATEAAAWQAAKIKLAGAVRRTA